MKMNPLTVPIKNQCPRSDIAAYIDGELTPGEELAIEIHFTGCPSCAAELNEQKRLLHVLDSALEKEREIELPANFTKVIVANAESKVSGLRHPKERFNALFVCMSLFFLAILGLGSETGAVLNTFVKIGAQCLAVAVFAAHLTSDIALGGFVILRSLSYQFVYGLSASPAFIIAVFFVSLAALSRLIVRFNRV